jgi:hypothetical protein
MVDSAFHVDRGLSAAARSRGLRAPGGVGATREHAVELAQQLVVREELRVVLREQGQQAPLVLAVVEQHDLVAARARVELAALVRVGEGDVEASAVPVVAAPSSETRPCTSAPSIVKKRRPGLGMSDV